MKEKEKLIIETAMKLFACKGVISTSVQEIATECGISKGAFYLYFESKEALLLATFHYYYDRIQSRVLEIENEGLNERDSFIKQMQCQFEELAQHKEFIIMHAREHAIPFNQDMAAFIQRMRSEGITFYTSHVFKLYGERITAHVNDIVLLLQGMLNAVMELIIFNKAQLEPARVAAYMVNRLDHLVEGLIQSQEQPLLSNNDLSNMMCSAFPQSPKDMRPILIQQIKHILAKVMEQQDSTHLQVTLKILLDEMEADEPRTPLIEGMLHNLTAIPELRSLQANIGVYYEIKAFAAPVKAVASDPN
ncbi:TetR/AcrR family transcriptional regulator [Paenibacillus sp. UMB4589-SE434]|uniref:TetR/AcrR family transcriptional regulator n=1 Tax=Paenibacillus sp. UMB4589-SE434 TaxID=3046314 RepID=UPI00254EB178|nr:TetR/AcrR family transcriptional regulator [Paenibacillus sp. UMB4589-SE434]MDK8181457.1 TetR/AcrR family transcriptional regulator [Paenibacillus sp. UMB4589-SE434]